MRFRTLPAAVVLAAAAVLIAVASAGIAPRKAISAADQSQARKILLPLADLPAGWKTNPPTKDSGPTATPQCPQITLSDLTETADVSRDFGPAGVALQDVESDVGMLKTRTQALALWQRVPTEKSYACAARSGAGLPKGSHVAFAHLAAPRIGERSVAWKFRMTIPGFPAPVYADQVFAMRGRTFAVVTLGTLGSAFDPALMRRLVLKVGARLDRYAR